MKRWLALAGAAVLAAASVFLLLLAIDTHRWQHKIAAGDIALRTDPGGGRLWTPTTILPAGISRGLLGVGDDVKLRGALQLFRLSRPRVPYYLTNNSIVAYRSEAQAALSRAIETERNPVRRAEETNLLGVLELIGVGGADPQLAQTVPQAADDFRNAVTLDPENADAKYNLELALRLLSRQHNGGAAQSGFGGTVAHGRQLGGGF
jgi:hypothetical protein